MLPKQRDVFNELHESLPSDLTNHWQTIPTDPIQLPSGKWSSPFQTTEMTGELSTLTADTAYGIASPRGKISGGSSTRTSRGARVSLQSIQEESCNQVAICSH